MSEQAASFTDEPPIDGTLAALADPVRRRAVELLAQRPRRAGELADELGTTRSTLSKHLRVLKQGGLVTETHPEFDARVRIYTMLPAPMTDLRAWLDLAERGWAEQLTAFADHLAHDSTVPDSTVPDSSTPHSIAPDRTVSDSTGPDSTLLNPPVRDSSAAAHVRDSSAAAPDTAAGAAAPEPPEDHW